jgi:hypothetical protein
LFFLLDQEGAVSKKVFKQMGEYQRIYTVSWDAAGNAGREAVETVFGQHVVFGQYRFRIVRVHYYL